jgi:hypothetical protein
VSCQRTRIERNEGPEGERVANKFHGYTKQDAANSPQETETDGESDATVRGTMQRLQKITHEQRANVMVTTLTSNAAGHEMKAVATGIKRRPTNEYTNLVSRTE